MEENTSQGEMIEQKKFYQKGYFLISAGLALFAVVMMWYAVDLGIVFPPQFTGEKVIEIRAGTSAREVVNSFFREGIIRQPTDFLLYLKVLGKERSIKPGTYYFAKATSVPHIVSLITSDFAERTVRIREGWTNFEIGNYLEKEGVVSKNLFLSVATGTEGYLFPDTYQIFQNTSAIDLIKKMRSEFDNKTAPLKAEIERKKILLKDLVIMASLIEKESAGDEDRAIISGILWKRLKNNRPLQVDATLSYLLGKESNDLTTDDLHINSPYNTYRYAGFPAGPIGNPGLKAIEAALYPKETPYWFYLHDANGKAYYAKTFEEHIENKNKYLR